MVCENARTCGQKCSQFGCCPTCVSIYALNAWWKTQGTFRKGLECVLSGAAALGDERVLRRLEGRVEHSSVSFSGGYKPSTVPSFPIPGAGPRLRSTFLGQRARDQSLGAPQRSGGQPGAQVVGSPLIQSHSDEMKASVLPRNSSRLTRSLATLTAESIST